MRARRTLVPGTLLALMAILVSVSIAAAPATTAAETGGAGEFGEPPPPEEAEPAGLTPFDRQGMWIWYIDKSDGGSIPRIIARAKRYGIGTLYVKAGDANDTWSQFNPALVDQLHRGGLEVCSWQFVYGDNPIGEAKVGAESVRDGADCLVIDAEGQYEGKYASADRYIRALRARIGANFPLSLAAFPYVDYHPSFPYSVFFGVEGATYNQPQMYWKAIETSVRGVYEHTYLYNRIWDHPLYPLGQTYGGAGPKSIQRFRRFAKTFGGLEVSWWDWQETTSAGWKALGADQLKPVGGYRPSFAHPILRAGSKGDMVVWAQQHLVSAGQNVPVTGIFGRITRGAVRRFQQGAGLPVDGVLGTSTWRALLNYDPVRTLWGGRKPKRGARASASASRAMPPSRPLSASLPAKGYEIDPGPRP
ncbi:MAG TPA: peptidoglycan-binding domain-containing protein [Solirubrobacterales bacterium]